MALLEEFGNLIYCLYIYILFKWDPYNIEMYLSMCFIYKISHRVIDGWVGLWIAVCLSYPVPSGKSVVVLL